MAASSGWDCRNLAVEAFQPVSDMLNVGRCEPVKAAVHGVLLATVALCALYNGAAWIKRRQRHLAINAIVYGAAIWWERAHVMHHLDECVPIETLQPSDPAELFQPSAPSLDEDRTAA